MALSLYSRALCEHLLGHSTLLPGGELCSEGPIFAYAAEWLVKIEHDVWPSRCCPTVGRRQRSVTVSDP